MTTASNERTRVIDRIRALDPSLAADAERLMDPPRYGLVFEHSRPEWHDLPGAPVTDGGLARPAGDPDAEPKRVAGAWEGAPLLEPAGGGAGPLERAAGPLTAVAAAGDPVYCGLKETGRVMRGEPDGPSQVVIEGENLHALQALRCAVARKVDCIYIDPPYNTGAKDWKYDNDYVDANDGYRHSKWLAFMERRLKLARGLLNPEGSVLICTIDEKEVNRLGLLLEQVFPTARIQMVSTMMCPGGQPRKKAFSRTDEYIFFVCIGDAAPARLPLGDEWLTGKNSNTKGLYWNPFKRSGTNNRRVHSPGCFYPVLLDETDSKVVGFGEPPEDDSWSPDMEGPDMPTPLHAVWPIRTDGVEGRWQVSPANARDLLAKGYIKVGRAQNGGVSLSYLKKGEQHKVETGQFKVIGHRPDGSIIVDESDYIPTFVPGSQWRIPSHDATRYGTQLTNALLGGKRFSYPKSLYAVEDCIRFFVADKPDAIVLDFFAGSGTTAHAVMRLNHADGGHRTSISVTNNEVGPKLEKELAAKGLKPGDPDWDRWGICEYVTKPRITAAITGRTPAGEPIRGRYRFTDEFDMDEGFHENAVFYRLTYENPDDVELGLSYEAIAPLLWLKAGAKGRVIGSEPDSGYAVADGYAVLFEYAAVNRLDDEIADRPEIAAVFVVTEDDLRYSNCRRRWPGRDVVRLYESYLRACDPDGLR